MVEKANAAKIILKAAKTDLNVIFFSLKVSVLVAYACLTFKGTNPVA